MMPRPRFERLPAAKRDRLLHEASREFGEHGYSGASMNHILEAAGVSKGAAYYYFDDKADLFATVVDHLWAHLLDETALDLDGLTARTFWPRLRAFNRHAMRRYQDTPWMSGVARAVWSLPPRAREEGPLAAVFARTYAFADRLLDRGRQLGVVRDDLPRDLLLALMAGMDTGSDRWMDANFHRLDADEAHRISDRVFDTMVRALSPARRRAR
jgi:AcrR family transcriptional regulator